LKELLFLFFLIRRFLLLYKYWAIIHFFNQSING
jgi:hypothetical protein